MAITIKRLCENWGVSFEDIKEDLQWIYDDPMMEFPYYDAESGVEKTQKKMTREIGILKQGGEVLRLKRAYEDNGCFYAFYKVDENFQSQGLFHGSPSVNVQDIDWQGYRHLFEKQK